MPPSNSEIPVKKIRYGQLRGTVAAKYRHRIALGVTLGSFAVSCLISYIFHVLELDPNKGLDKIENPMLALRKRGYKPLMEQIETHIDPDDL